MKNIRNFLTTAIMAQALMNTAGGLFLSPDAQEAFNVFSPRPAYAAETAALKYTWAMHPQIISDSPGKCPICGIDLVPLAGGHDHDASAPQAVTPVTAPVAKDSSERKFSIGTIQ